MKFNTAPVSAITQELGSRLKRARLNKNLTQQEVADKVGVARRTLVAAEQGNARLDTFVGIMQILGVADQLNLFLPEQDISPLQLAKLKGKQRQRASGHLSPDEDMEQW
ncbi:helix-turn-helix transcriptional regulator [Alteromonas halophila]|uniref:HTH cro/C1-type domain-containing protein n=1 Tax=Alteromonas halophila TaxID=516698 RepID=A0A918JL47_9ALTE|nr:helix-turn-helix transcriptional regulator [Alteromonas halophila]GGW87374.1 hypothetical protein GCM10007391_21620 [Alteromonas halophila]